jgi:hypothetical protein
MIELPYCLIIEATNEPDFFSTEQLIRKHPKVKRLLNNRNWRDAAEAAIAYYSHGQPSQVEGWKESRTWAQVKMVFEELGHRGTAPPDATADNR